MAGKKRKRAGSGRERSTPPDGGEAAESSGKSTKDQGTTLEWTKSILVAVVLFLVLRTFLVQTFVITSGSMEETLLVGDFLLVDRAAMGSAVPFTNWRVPGYSRPKRFDVLVFDPPHEEDLKLVKRLVGLPGDTLSMEGGVLSLNGLPQDESYVRHADPRDEFHPWMSWQAEHLVGGTDRATYSPTRDNWGPLVVPDGHYFMLGDNRDTSLDSRYWGLLESWRVEGRAFRIYFSYNRGSFRPFPWIREVRGSRIGRAIR